MVDWDEYEEGGMMELPETKTEVVARKVTPVFFLIDTSSMSGIKIDAVNNAMKEIIHELSGLESPDFDLRYAVLSFGTECKWETGDDYLVRCCDDVWADLSTCDGEADFNTACKMLKEKMSAKRGFFRFATGITIMPPLIVLLIGGFVKADNPDDVNGIEELKTNRYFRDSVKLAIAIGENANLKLCENFTDDKEMVWTAYNEKAFRKILDAIRFATISTGALMDDEDENSEITESEIATLKDAIKNEFESDFTDENDVSLAGDVRILVNDDDFKWDSDWDEEILSEYRIEGKTMRFNETYDVCVCQFGKSMPNEALNAVYKVSVAYQNKLTVKNVSDKCREVIVRLKPGEAIEISKPDSIGLTYGNQTVPIYTGSWSEFDWTPDGSDGTWE